MADNNHACQIDGMNEALLIRRPEIFAICKRFKVKRLDVFGDSVTGGEEIGFLVDFLEYGPWHNVEAYFGLQRALEGIFNEDQDIGYFDVAALNDPYLKRSVEKTRTPFYGPRDLTRSSFSPI